MGGVWRVYGQVKSCYGAVANKVRNAASNPKSVMKKVGIILLSLTALVQTQAQLLHPESVEGAFWGSLIGGIAGGDRCHGFSGKGAAIGAGVGLIAGSLVGESRRYDREDYYDSTGSVYPATSSVNVSFGYGYGGCGSSAYVYYAPNRYCAPGTYYRPTRPNYVVSGTVLGAASGALIGSANHHNAGKGAAIGAATGLILGSVAEHNARREERAYATQVVYPVTQTASQTAVVQPATPKAEITSKPCATSTYTWTARPQIADAPRVPDAPTF